MRRICLFFAVIVALTVVSPAVFAGPSKSEAALQAKSSAKMTAFQGSLSGYGRKRVPGACRERHSMRRLRV